MVGALSVCGARWLGRQQGTLPDKELQIAIELCGGFLNIFQRIRLFEAGGQEAVKASVEVCSIDDGIADSRCVIGVRVGSVEIDQATHLLWMMGGDGAHFLTSQGVAD